MPIFERIDINKKRPIPVTIKLILLLAVIFGIYLRSCWKKNQEKQITISNIEISNITSANIDVRFNITNNTKMDLIKSLIIKIYSNTNQEIASKITRVKIPALSKRRYLKVIHKFNRPIKENETGLKSTVNIYIPSIL
ncbi:MAG: hypothetical protein DRJ01_16895 [Bacteroidetes bacterium]|nr:MAG: hypothetical protein DRJ01_16895 [Bacteroidota bacterium]